MPATFLHRFKLCSVFHICVFFSSNFRYTSSTEVIFTAIYTYESAVKLLARGFFMDKFTYLRDAWNWLDISVIGMSYVTIAIGEQTNIQTNILSLLISTIQFGKISN